LSRFDAANFFKGNLGFVGGRRTRKRSELMLHLLSGNTIEAPRNHSSRHGLFLCRD
jgi:hypothetical protein